MTEETNGQQQGDGMNPDGMDGRSGNTEPRRLVVSSALDGERLDRCLSIVTGRSRSAIAELISEGQVRVNDHVVTIRHERVVLGGEVIFTLGEDAQEVLPQPAAPGAVRFDVVYEDDSVIVVNKPAGLVVHPGAGHLDDTLVSGLLARFSDVRERAADGRLDPLRPGIVHRLDRDTSGLLVVARTESSLESLSAQLETRSMGREYLALALGLVTSEEGVIEAPIGRSVRFPTKMTVQAGGRDARTMYRVLSRFSEPVAATLLHLTLETGRTHQIRVHLRAIGHPVAGDTSYGGITPALSLSRPFLHAARLRFVHPATNEVVTFESDLPAELERVLELMDPL